MAASACGAVYVWRDYTFRNTQRLAAAWPVTPRPNSPSPCLPNRAAARPDAHGVLLALPVA